MEILISAVMVIIGLFMMIFGGNALVDGSVSIAKKMKMSEAIIGLTIVAIGTSVPELVVSILAALRGSADIAIGNVLGSNIANIYLVLGVTAIITPVVLKKSTRFFDLPVVILTTLLLGLMVMDQLLDGDVLNTISRTDGIVFLVFAFLYILYSVIHNNFVPDESEKVEIISSISKSMLWVVGGIGVLFFGGQLLVNGAVDLARMMGVTESVIGLTVVAIGTSMPELVTSVLAAKRWNPDIAIGNVVGSTVMNIFVILGVSSVITPMRFSDSSFIDLAVSLSAPMAVLLLGFSFDKNRARQLLRRDGIILLLVYILYITYLLFQEIK